MIRSFASQGIEDIFNGNNTKEARQTLPRDLWERAADKLDVIDVAKFLKDLRIPAGNRLEPLNGDRAVQYSIRINEQYRICFTWTDEGPEAVEIVDYH